jgi:CubicO group peptidase (beta-lactamase class C family)
VTEQLDPLRRLRQYTGMALAVTVPARTWSSAMRFVTRLMIPVLLAVPAAAAAQTPDAQARVDRAFEQWATPASPGCAVGVSHAGNTVLRTAYGMADLEHGIANTSETIFEAGSVSKQFTAAAILLLAQRGMLTLDDDVRRYVPELPDYGHTITIRHLMTHTSGLRDWGSVAAIGGWGRSARTHTHDHVVDILSRQRALNFRPGDEYSYSNSGYNLMAVIVGRVSGESFAEFSRRHIFEPLGMNDTQWRDDYTRIVRGRSSAYARRGNDWVIDRPIENVHGNGGLLTTVADLLAWNEALTEARFGGAELIAMLHTRQVLNSGEQIEYAGGLNITEYNGVPEIVHTGATSGYRAFLARYPAQRVSVAVLCNAANASPASVGHLVADAFLGDAVRPAATAPRPAGQTPRAPAPTLAPAELQALAGEYYSPDAESALRVAVEDGVLVAHRRPAARMVLTPVAQDVFDSALGRITFIRDQDGHVSQLGVRQARVYDLRFDRVAR